METDWRCIGPGCLWRNNLAEAAVRLLKSMSDLSLASQSTLTFAEMDTHFSRVADLVNQRPIVIKSFVEAISMQ